VSGVRLSPTSTRNSMAGKTFVSVWKGRESTEKPLWVQLTMLLAKRSFTSSRKNAVNLWRKRALILARSMGERWTNRPW
jgi:hypothetical protein